MVNFLEMKRKCDNHYESQNDENLRMEEEKVILLGRSTQETSKDLRVDMLSAQLIKIL